MSRRFSSAIAILFFLLSSVTYAAAMPTPAAPIIGAKSFLVIDSKTGHEIAALNPDESLAPASLTKIMTTYVVFSALKARACSSKSAPG
jgi:D-alanyl-D-alanine carboxypeptidase (penicillin-binding protein 5/6)